MYRVGGTKLVNNMNDWNPTGVRTKRQPKKRWSNKRITEAKIEKLEPNFQR